MTIEAGPDDRMDVGANQSDAPADDRLDHEKLNEMPESNARRLTLEGYRANECPWCEEPADAYDCATEWSGTESGGNVMTVTQTCHDCRNFRTLGVVPCWPFGNFNLHF